MIPRAEALHRFRRGLDSVGSLAGGARSREALVRGFVDALEHRDTTTLRGLVMTKAEFAWVYYPTNPQGRPPYDLSPDLLWFLIEERSRQGIAQALEDRAGRPLRYVDHRCDAGASREGANTIYGPCVVRRLLAPGDTLTERLFGPIIERDGRFKFVSYANKL